MNEGDKVKIINQPMTEGEIYAINRSHGIAVVRFDARAANGKQFGSWPLSELELIEPVAGNVGHYYAEADEPKAD